MNAIDILGAILGRRAGSAGGGMAKDVIRKQQPKPKVEPAPRRQRQRDYESDSSYRLPSGGATDLDDLMREAHASFNRETRGEYQDSLEGPEPQREERRERPPSRSSRAEPRSFEAEPRSFGDEPRSFGEPDRDRNEQAKILIRAMVMAAKSDGRIDQSEQDEIVGELGGRLSQDQVRFLRDEFARPVDVRQLVRSVPDGMEEHVYVASLMAIDLDNNSEAQHLHTLAKAFGISPDHCNQIHRRYRAPELY